MIVSGGRFVNYSNYNHFIMLDSSKKTPYDNNQCAGIPPLAAVGARLNFSAIFP